MNAPYQLPPWSQVRLVADRQRQVLWTFLAGLLLLPVSLAVAAAGPSVPPTAVAVVSIAVVGVVLATRVAMAIAVYRLTAAWESTVPVLWAIGAFLPNVIGLVVLLVANGRATAFLKRAGVKVGFLGVKLGETPPPGSAHADHLSDVFS